MKMKIKHTNIYGMQQKQYQREVYRNTALPQEQEKSQINNLALHLKKLEKEEQTKPKVSRRKEIIQIRGKIESKRTGKINKTKSWFFEKTKQK